MVDRVDPCVESLIDNVEVERHISMAVAKGGASRDHLILMKQIAGIIPSMK